MALGANETRMPFCATKEPSEELVKFHQYFSKHEGMARRSEPLSEIEVGVWVHVVVPARDNSSNVAYITLKVLNVAFAPAAISFHLLGADRTYNAGWATGHDGRSMKKALYKGGQDRLNIYIVEKPFANEDDITGYTILPSHLWGTHDGIVIRASTIPGAVHEDINTDGKSYLWDGYRAGVVLVHETSHWFGLLHTFEGNDCDGPGDYVDDTPAQKEATGVCGIRKDSCPGSPGQDPANNYMDYLPEFVTPTESERKSN
ncbi:hypothetical protein DCS_03356 [Drechmeria coniospora]|uniref:Peptidase M43 pregnancy-associated plasma-A domain-containing protein n=1 Tax=Drechmeria coniospora TaxID=98403 RepID=A0A151GH12_DRECN|nr:hypothetical protein DCS_03356 [Drechmeria coniospora]KYK56356.1 hypothetical protein DCS_03356 [Drechmeria coniospora]